MHWQSAISHISKLERNNTPKETSQVLMRMLCAMYQNSTFNTELNKLDIKQLSASHVYCRLTLKLSSLAG